ncbi:MAG: hypothetical protein ACXWZU_09320 [Actinomycetota bacterium]
MPDPSGTERLADDVVSFTPSSAESALIFGMNLAVLVDRGEVLPQPALAADLRGIADGEHDAEPVVWRMRQLAFRRMAVSEEAASD